MRTSLYVVTLLGTLAACGGSSTELEGVYTIESWTDNPDDCSAPGGSILELSDPMAYIKMENFLGVDFLNFNTCEDTGDCQTLAADDETIHLGQFGFETGSDDDGWSTESVSAFQADPGAACTGDYVRTTLVADGDGVSIRVERIAIEFPDPGDECFGQDSDDAGREAAEGLPCTSQQLLHASFTTEL